MSDDNGKVGKPGEGRPSLETRRARSEAYAKWRTEYLAGRVADAKAKVERGEVLAPQDRGWHKREYRTGDDPLGPKGRLDEIR